MTSKSVSADQLSPRLAKLCRINQTMAARLDISEVLKSSLELEKDVVDAETGSILLLDDSGDYLEFAVALGDAGQLLKNHRVKVGEGIAGSVAQSRLPLLIEDVESDPRFNAYFDSKTGFKTRSILCVPLMAQDKLIGVAQVINRADGGHFTEEDLLLFSAFAGTMTVAIENARLHKRILDQEKIRQEISAARQVQESYLPQSLPRVPGLEFAGFLLPARQVSGDFYDAFETGDGRWAMAIGDVSGKGLASAMYMCRLLTELRARLSHGQSAAKVLADVNQILVEQSTRGMFVTMILFILDPKQRRIIVGNAGHLPYFIRTASGWSEVRADKNPPLGILPGRQFTTHLQDAGAILDLIAFTDGVTEARRTDGELFGMDRFRALLDHSRLTPKLLAEKIRLDLEGFCEGMADPADDTTVLAAGREGRRELAFDIYSHPRYLGMVRQAAESLLGDAARKELNEIQLALCEAITNVMRHTYRDDKTKRIEITMRRNDEPFDPSTGLLAQGGQFETSIRDFGPRVDETKIESRKLEDVRPGGLGVHFIRSAFDSVCYDPNVTDGNRLTLSKQIRGGGSA